MSLTLVLASTSKYRRALLERLDVQFVTAAPVFDEDAHREGFTRCGDDEFALEMALGKARSLVPMFGDAWILAADQVATLPAPNRRLLCKPGTEAAAVDQLMVLSGKTHQLTTGVVLLDAGSGAYQTAIDRQSLVMRAFARDEAVAYVARYRPLDCAGSYRIEDAGIALFESIDGADFTGIIGLPLLAVARLLRSVALLQPPH